MILEIKDETTWEQYDDTYKSFAEPSIAYPLTDIDIENFDPFGFARKKRRRPPPPFSIAQFKELVSHLPVELESVDTGINRWKRYFKEHDKLASIFSKQKTITISRADIFSAAKSGDLEKVLFLTVLWGYPVGMLGSFHENIFKNKHMLIKYLEEAVASSTLSFWEDYWFAVTQVSGLGISLLSKLLYFCGVHVETLPALILDKRVIGAISSNRFKEFEEFGYISYPKAMYRYVEYLEAICDIAKNLDVAPPQVEIFLRVFGQHVKA